MVNEELLKKIENVRYVGDAINVLFDNKFLGMYNVENDNIDDLIKIIEYVGEYFYHPNGLLKIGIDKMIGEYDDLKKVFLMRNMKILYDQFMIDIKNNKERFSVICHAKQIKTILTLILNVPLRIDKKLYKEAPSGLTYSIFGVEDSYSMRLSDETIKTLKGEGPHNVQRRLRILQTRKILKEYAESQGLETEGVFALLPKGK